MTKSTRLFAGALVVASGSLIAFAQVTVAPPTTTPSSTDTRPSPASTMPSAQNVMQDLIKDKPNVGAARQIAPPSTTNPNVTHAVAAVAPNEPEAARRREGDIVQGTGHLMRDAKTESYIFVFDSDGKKMQDPPITLLPSKYLQSMEETSNNGAKGTRFKISGELTEYRGKNFLHVRYVLVLRDLNQGLGY